MRARGGFATGLLAATALAGAAALGAGLATAPAATWPSVLLTWFLVLGLGMGGALFVAIHDAIGARWASGFRRVPEAMAATVPWTGLGVLVILAGLHPLYAWSRPEVVAADPVLAFKGWWLNATGFRIRSVGYVLAWALAIRAMLANAHGPAPDRDRGIRRAVVFLVLFGGTFTLASMDWIMTLEPRWSSTIFPIYVFAGVFQSALAMLIVLLAAFREEGPAEEPTPAHLHDLGKLLFAFSCFWIYMWYSQYLLIWFANLPDEIRYFTLRDGGWLRLTVLLLLVSFVVPFFSLISKPFKRSPVMLVTVSVVVLLSHWLDLFVMIHPALSPGGPRLTAAGLLGPLGGVAGFILLFRRAYRTSPPVD